jgi:menaquinone-specific isochorismate synthase
VSSRIARTRLLRSAGDPLRYVPAAGAIFWSRGARTLAAYGEVARIVPGVGDDRVGRASRQLSAVLGSLQVENEVGGWGTGPLAFGAFSFDPDSSESSVVVPRVVVGRDDERTWVTTIGEAPTRAATQPWAGPGHARRDGSSISDEAWLAAATSARDLVRDGVVEKVVLARDAHLEGDQPFDARSIAERLVESNPECYTFAFEGLVGASPELLVRREHGAVESVVLGGSKPRGDTDERDELLSARLLASPKERHEHALAVQTVSATLGEVCTDVEIEDAPSLLSLSYVHHLRTSVRAGRCGGLSALELAGTLHPTAAVCGVPTDKALAAIRELEGMDRARYCGPVGWVDAVGNGEWAIALRCAELRGSTARLFAGAGIVAQSDPVAELDETELKLSPLLDALGTRRRGGP